MKQAAILFFLHLICGKAFCQNDVSKGKYDIPDSINAVGYYVEIRFANDDRSKYGMSGSAANEISVGLSYNDGRKVVQFIFSGAQKKALTTGNSYLMGQGYCAWNYNWKANETYGLLIASASDSATNKTLWSGYIFLPNEKKWKLICTVSNADTLGIKTIRMIRNKTDATFSNRWLQRTDGSWKALDGQTTKPPSLRQMSNIDSLSQQAMEELELGAALPKDSITYEAGMFYQTLKEGTGRFIKVTDTLTVHYKGSLFSDGTVFDETKNKPATFPLGRLIKGWQTGLVHCRVGGKMRLFIPSGSAYGIRNRAATIPPNSILVFDVEVLGAKGKIEK